MSPPSLYRICDVIWFGNDYATRVSIFQKNIFLIHNEVNKYRMQYDMFQRNASAMSTGRILQYMFQS